MGSIFELHAAYRVLLNYLLCSALNSMSRGRRNLCPHVSFRRFQIIIRFFGKSNKVPTPTRFRVRINHPD